MNERTDFFIKIYLSHFILERVDVSVVCERWVERHIFRERTSSSHIFFLKPGNANASTPLQARQRRFCSAACPTLNSILCTLSKSDRVVLITWSPSGYTRVVPECHDRVVLFNIHNVGVTRNELKIHVICYITGTIIVFWPILIMLQSGRSQLVFLFTSLPVQPLRNCYECTNYYWYHRHLHVP